LRKWLRAAGNVLGSSLRMNLRVPSTYCSRYGFHSISVTSKLKVLRSRGCKCVSSRITLSFVNCHSCVVKNSRHEIARCSFFCTRTILWQRRGEEYRLVAPQLL
jgi:hypothetical protein